MVDGGILGQLFDTLAQTGFFDYVLPFLIIFSVVYGILLKIQIFKDNKAVNGIIALAVGLLALQFDLVPVFFSEIFPKFGIAIAIILIILILIGLFLPINQAWISYTLFGVAAAILIGVFWKSFGGMGYDIGAMLSSPGAILIIFLLFIIILIAILANAGKQKKDPITAITQSIKNAVGA
jgi:hypothetical protein